MMVMTDMGSSSNQLVERLRLEDRERGSAAEAEIMVTVHSIVRKIAMTVPSDDSVFK